MIVVSNLTYQYPDGKTALENISFSVKKGERIAVIGANGAGKSTLLLHFNGVLLGKGSVSINGLPITKENLAKIRSSVGMVFQNPDDQLFSLTVAEDVGYGPAYQGYSKTEVAQRVTKALDEVQMQGFEERNPYHLSGGEKKRISIATVLSMEPDILVLDEPTAGLDPKARRELIELLQRLPHTMIIASHDLPMVAQLASRVIVLNHGKIAADDTPSTILSDQDCLIANNLF